MESLLRSLGILAGCLAVLFLLRYGGLWLLFVIATHPSTIGEYDLGGGIEAELFVEADLDVGDVLYYRAERDGLELVHTTFLGLHDRSDPVEITTFKTEDESLVGLHGRQGMKSDCHVFIVIDSESGESWPRESIWDPAAQANWSQRFSRLKASIPDLPCVDHYYAPNESLEASATTAVPQL